MSSTTSIQDKTIVFSGTLSSQTRAEATKLAKQHGATVKTSVTKAIDILVAGPGAGSEIAAAEKHGAEIWSEDDFNAAVGGKTSNDAEEEEEEEVKSPKATGGGAAPTNKRRKAAPSTPSTPTPDEMPKSAKRAKKSPGVTNKKTPPPETPSAPHKKTMAPATPAVPGSSKRRVMSAHAQKADNHEVYQDYDVKLMLSDSLNANSNKFYKLQLLVNKNNDDDSRFFVATNWGRLGEPGQSQFKGPHNEENGIKEFCKVFRNKTKNDWGTPFVRHGDKYQIVETTEGSDGGGGGSGGDSGDDAALGRLTESQIHKGQNVPKQIREMLTSSSSKQTTTTLSQNNRVLGELSNEFYSLIPTTSGRQRPPKLDNEEIVTEKEGLLEFWLRMGFDDMENVDETGSPIEGMLDLPVPKTLLSAAGSISDKHSIDSSRNRGSELAKNMAGNPVKTMGPELYGAILLYTGNSIYRELNRCLRMEWKSVKKYFHYLRLYSEAMDAMPNRPVTLWRGIAADLWNEYQVGKIITWWSISSCTASKQVAENFMGQLGKGSNATFLTLHTKTACDISALSFYPHEQESLLRPGTMLKVLKRTKNGMIAHIEMEEVVGGG